MGSRLMAEDGTLKVTTPTEREIVMTRSFEAPRQLVFEACTRPDLIKRWMLSPSDWPMVVCETDLRVGGSLRFEWKGPDGGEMGLSGIYREIVLPERIVHTEQFDEDWTGGETLVTWLLTEQDGKTRVTVTTLYSSREARDGALRSPMEECLSHFYNRLEELLAQMQTTVAQPSTREIVFTRLFDAPRELMWEAWTDPERVAQWWGPTGFTTTTYEMNVRPGGVWRFIMHGPDGTDYPNKIIYTEVVRPERLAFLHGPDNEDESGQFRVTVTFTDQDGKTLVNMRSVFATAEGRDMVVREYGAIEGGKQTLERLAQHLEERRRQ